MQIHLQLCPNLIPLIIQSIYFFAVANVANVANANSSTTVPKFDSINYTEYIFFCSYVRPKKRNCLFPVTVRKKNRVGRSVKKNFFHYFFGKKCVFYACFSLIGSWEGEKNFRVGIFLNKNLLG